MTPNTIAHQSPLPVGFPRQEYWSGLPFPTPGDLPDPGIEPASLLSSALAGRFFTTSDTLEALHTIYAKINSRYIKDINVIYKAIKAPEKNWGLIIFEEGKILMKVSRKNSVK